MIFESGQRVVFIGDSITDCGRRDVAAPYGDGYLSLIRAFVTASHPGSDSPGSTTASAVTRCDAVIAQTFLAAVG